MAAGRSIIWARSSGCLSEETLKAIYGGPPPEQLVVILPSNGCSERGGPLRSFGDYYRLLYETYELVLASMSVEAGLRVDLKVLLYPDFCALGALGLGERGTRFFAVGDPALPEEASTDGMDWIQVGDSPANHCSHLEPRPGSPAFHFESIAVLMGYDVVALGGTFDHLHAGHKIMISASILLAKQRLIIGLTDTSMLQSKRFQDCLLSYPERLNAVRQFTELFLGPRSGRLEVEVVRLVDPFGPTISTPNIDLLVVSEETLPGAMEINRIRKERSMKALEVVAVQFVKLCDRERISSTLIRGRLKQ